MSETPQPTPAPAPPESKPYWLYRLAAWVAIVAGIVFIVSTIFVAGIYASGGMRGHHCHHGHHGPQHGAQFHQDHHRGPGPMMPGTGPGELPPSVNKPAAPGR